MANLMVLDAQLFKEAWLKAQKENEVLFSAEAGDNKEGEAAETKEEKKEETKEETKAEEEKKAEPTATS